MTAVIEPALARRLGELGDQPDPLFPMDPPAIDGEWWDAIGLFEGYGGLTRAALNVLGGRLIAYSEIEPAACRLLAAHHPDVPNLGDVTTVDWATVPRRPGRPLVLTGGPPCQDVSSAGRRAGLRPGTRSGLWHHMAYAIEELRPDLVVIENVRGLLTARGAEPTDELLAAWADRDKARRVLALIESKLRRAQREGKTSHVHWHQRDRGRFLGRIRQAVAAAKRADALIVRAIGAVLGDLADLGFDAEWVGLPASDVGAPHARFRIFILAWPAADTGHGVLEAHAGGMAGWPTSRERGDAGPDRRFGDRGHASAADPGGGKLQRRGVGGVLAGPEGAGAGEGSQRQRDRHAAGHGGEDAPDPDSVGPARAGSARAGRPGSADHHLLAAHAHGGGLGPDVGDDAARQPDAERRGEAASDSVCDGREGRPERDLGAEGGEPAPQRGDAARRVLDAADWGDYAPAIERWELILGRPAPAPTQTGARGGQQLSPAFVEFMMGLPEGHVTGVPGLSRAEQLKMLGNGVVAQQAEAAIRHMLAAADVPTPCEVPA